MDVCDITDSENCTWLQQSQSAPCEHSLSRVSRITAAEDVMKLRKYGRIAVELAASFSGASFRAPGVIVDISLTGCRVQSELSVQKNDALGVLIDVPGWDNPLYISQAIIRWANAPEFGLEFIQMELTDRQRLHEVVQRNAGER